MSGDPRFSNLDDHALATLGRTLRRDLRREFYDDDLVEIATAVVEELLHRADKINDAAWQRALGGMK